MNKPASATIDSDVPAKESSSSVKVWRFVDAPAALRMLHRHLPPPEWLVFIPYARVGSDLDESITGGPGSIDVCRYETATGDVIYTGSSLMNKAGKHLRTTRTSIPAHA
jgi:hypothetical protein